MSDLLGLSDQELELRIKESNAELQRRGIISAARAEIEQTLAKYQLRLSDIQPIKEPSPKASKPKQKATETTRRSKAKVKYKSPDRFFSWTGRGRAPHWVVKICESENIDIATFKTDPRFKA